MLYVFALWTLAVVLLFGGFFLWPIFWLVDRTNSRRLRGLRILGLSQLLLQGGALALVMYCRNFTQDWLHCLIVPYGIGMACLLVGLVIILRVNEAGG